MKESDTFKIRFEITFLKKAFIASIKNRSDFRGFHNSISLYNKGEGYAKLVKYIPMLNVKNAVW